MTQHNLADRPRSLPVLLVVVCLTVGCGRAVPTTGSSPVSTRTTATATATATPAVAVTATPSPPVATSTPTATSTAGGAWQTTGSMRTARNGYTATLLQDGQVLVAGGVDDDGNNLLATAELYDPASGTWSLTGSMAQPRAMQTATLLQDGQVLVAGGEGPAGSGDPLTSAELYDPVTGRWTPTGGLHTGRWDHTATLLGDGRVLVAGGWDWATAERLYLQLAAYASAELYDPATGCWTATGSMVVDRAGATATLLRDGRVLVAGGELSGDELAAELYDPATGRWTSTGDMTDMRRNHTATLLQDGRVLVAGGFAGTGYTYNGPCTGPTAPCSAELYDPDADRWTPTGSMHVDRSGHAAVLLGGTVLVVGGLGVPERAASAELYDPHTGRWTLMASPPSAWCPSLTLLLDGRVLVIGDETGRATFLYAPGIGD